MNRKAVASFSPGLPFRLPWERLIVEFPTPTGLRLRAESGTYRELKRRNRVAVGTISWPISQRSRSGNVGLKDATALRLVFLLKSMTTLSLSNISKRFGPTVALDGVNLRLQKGAVHALIGENGA